jgi:hypothetical protein
VIDATGARALFERPRQVTWVLEQDGAAQDEPGMQEPAGHDGLRTPIEGNAARARVKSAGEPLVLDLQDGAIEAQVVPVARGEAFAVDVGTERGVVRVAVHGTHLRVARAGNRVVVDLTEGVVSIGVPPRVGVTYGTLVTAPAHVELDATDLRTLRIDHTPASVRAPIPLVHEGAVGLRAEAPPLAVASAEPPQAAVVASAPKDAVVHASEPALTAKVEPRKAAVPPREAIAAAVRNCAAARSQSGEVHVTVTSNLSLQVSGGGMVENAQFSPPLPADVQDCAAKVIYKAKLEETGLVAIPIEFSY